MAEGKHRRPDSNTGGMDRNSTGASPPLVLPLDQADADKLTLVGGKAANLGRLSRSGMPVPSGFCITTAAYDLMDRQAQLEPLVHDLALVKAPDAGSIQQRAADIRTAILDTPIPALVEDAIRGAYLALERSVNGRKTTPVAVAVRSSATAEDLPFASFAGQQETYLNVVGIEAILDAVRRCWASLWTDRAVSYRATNDIDQRTVRLAVVVQAMVDAQVSGILFTANPLTGKRHQAVIDSSSGLGEAVVSGAVNPDHFVVDPLTGKVLERHLGDKRVAVRPLPGGGTGHIEVTGAQNAFSLTDKQVVTLAQFGASVEKDFGAPQDIEWAIDEKGVIWLLQSRPITTLYPLPAGIPTGRDDLRVYFSVNVAQGVFRPFTPMGICAFHLMGTSAGNLIGFPPSDPVAGPSIMHTAGQRLFIDATKALRSRVGFRILSFAMGKMEARSRALFEQMAADPRLAPKSAPRHVAARGALRFFARVRRAPLYALQALLSPAAARRRMCRIEKRLRKLSTSTAALTSEERLDTFERLLVDNTAPVIMSFLPIIPFVFGLPAVLARLLGETATEEERQAVLRGLPYNPTTEMDLALWKLAVRVQRAPGTGKLFRELTPEQFAARYHEGVLPPVLQRGLADFLHVYGHRAVAEIDMGLPRWSEDPTHLFGVLATYLQIKDPNAAPDVQFRRGASEARKMRATLTKRAMKRSHLRGLLVSFCLDRMHRLTGLREMPKYVLTLLLYKGRQLLIPVGEELERAGRLDDRDGIFFIDTREAREGLAGRDLRDLVRQRRASYQQELGRRHIPRVFLSDGTEPELEVSYRAKGAPGTENVLDGAPASAGVVTGKARVVLDPTNARLEPGEILVAPSTDPGWTPLFLVAGGLVMEMGGAMSHGAVVAREYGIPAVVGVHGATERIATGDQITVDGSEGKVYTAIE